MRVGCTKTFLSSLLSICNVRVFWILLISILLQTVSSQDNRPPIFSSSQYVFSVYENAPVGSELTATSPLDGIIATDNENDTILYEKMDITDIPEISLNQTTGALTIAMALDREAVASYSFDIVANDNQRGGLFLPTVTVQIVVLDINDNSPFFVNSPYSYSIEEGVSNGYQVNPSDGRITVTDADIGNNQPSVFSIIDGSDNRFTIDPNGNIITTLDESVAVRRIIDFETKQFYNILVRASNTESGPSGPVYSEINITISITNVNDEVPIFSTASQNRTLTISETMVGVIFTVEALDTDATLSTLTTFTYSIVFGNNPINGLGSFAIASSGAVSVAVTMLDYETHSQYSLVIQAEENQSPKSSILTTLTINIEDSNEFPPQFIQSTFQTDISEASDINSAVLLVIAEDLDPSHTVTYSLDGSADSSTFSIDSSNGLISLVTSLDRETQDTYTFEVISTDDDVSSPSSDTADVIIRVTDENDNSPIFTDDEQMTTFDEKVTTIPAVIYDVITRNPISDIDDGVNQLVKYSLQTGDSAFSLDPDSGILSVVAVLDFSIQSVYKLTVVATDQAVLATERRTGSFVLTINVNDVNDNSPVLAPIGPQTLKEGLPSGNIVFTVSATDTDDGLSTPLSFSILEGAAVPFSLVTIGTPTNTFASAHISTTRALNFEATVDKIYSLTIQVSDGTNTDSEIVIVTTEDINDNSPIFSLPSGYFFTADESETGTIIGSVLATDADTSLFGPVNYEKTGDSEDYFQVDSNTGEVTIQIQLDAETFPNYRFSIVAFDSGVPPLSEIVIITVTIQDVNDNSPSFIISSVEVSIDENTAVPNIFTFIAVDNDRDSPNKDVKYFITESFPVVTDISSLFTIDEDSGTIQSTNAPNREDFNEITLTIEARDQGTPVLSDIAIIRITLNDLNDNSPAFESPSYTLDVDEDTLTSETLIQVRAVETPEDANTQIIYSLAIPTGITDNPLEFVTIDSGTGVITAAKSLDFETLPNLILDIIATDGSLTDTATLTITVNNINDNDPILTVQTCSMALPEDLGLGPFCTLGVMDKDQDNTTEFTLISSGFSLTPSLSEFAIVYSDGATTATLELQSSLDFEQTKSYPLIITIVDRGHPNTRSTTLSLPLTVTGINEYAPVFSTLTYTFFMDETERINSVIGIVTATDADDSSTSDGIFMYSFPGGALPFNLDSSSGAISLNAQVDYEQNTVFTFDVFASDTTFGNQKTGTAVVTVIVVDNNENPPIFDLITVTPISEDIAADVLVVQVSATDADRDDIITFSIIEGNNDGVFRIDPTTGEITTTVISPDFEVYSSYILIVQATDNGTNPRTTSTPVKVTILDVNDNPPAFDRPPVDSIVDERVIGRFIMLVSATDRDSTTNAIIDYSVDLVTEFSMNPSTGILTTKIALDRESTSSYFIQICATDRGSPLLSVCQSVTITIADVNDNTPSFLGTSVTTVSIPENTNGGQLVATFTVTDLDENPSFFFTLLDGGGPFSISSSGDTATVTISGTSSYAPLDRELIDQYSLVVTVNDGGLSISHNFDVLLLDVNDEIPELNKDTYIVASELIENSIDGTPVLTVAAIDNDISPNNIISYSLIDSSQNRFRIDGTSGEIVVNIQLGAGTIDFETSTSHTLIVQSSDGTLTDTATVYIPIGDDNDNDPIFLESSYSIQVLESAAIGTTILAVQAEDADSGLNGEVKYDIFTTNTDVTSTFQIGMTSGIITTILLLDADVDPTEYSFQIRAQDSSSASVRSTLVQVTISIIGLNEAIPVFSSSLYTGTINEETSPINNILTIVATESDSSAAILYDIVDSGAKFYFQINPISGQLSLIHSLDREEFEEFTFTVSASDNENPPRQGFSSVKISIQDINDNYPVFLLNQYTVTISESTPSLTEIVTIRATDADATPAFNQIVYSIATSSVPFSINPTTGQVSVQGTIDFDQGPKFFSISVSATDGVLSGTTNLFIQLTDENDISPVITNTDFSITISESSPGGTDVIDINVEDIDTVGTISYIIVSGNTGNSFFIDSSGLVTLTANGLDFESIAAYTLGIEVSDGSNMVASRLLFGKKTCPNQLKLLFNCEDSYLTTIVRYLSSQHSGLGHGLRRRFMISKVTATISITVTDSNDHFPTFDQDQYFVSRVENDLPGTTILSFTLTDLDSGKDGEISSFIDPSSNTANMFELRTVTPTSFAIVSALPLDRETSGLIIENSFGSAKWVLKVIAYDNNDIIANRLSSTVDVLITVTDVNDNSPLFSSSSYSTQVSESSNIGTLVINLIASDLDFGTNAIITFRFASTSSNTGNFTLNNITGELRTGSVLSREISSTLIVSVEVTDGLLVDSAVITITITDINDHNPVFAVSSTSASIEENSMVGTSVADVSASDEDDGDNGRITILIIGGDPNSQFKVSNTNSGTYQVQVAKDNIDRESQSSYELILAAQDHGIPTRQDTSIVLISILDVNDNPPVFSPIQYSGSIFENAIGGATVTLNTPIQISDLDQGVNSQISFSLDDASTFFISNTQTIILNPSASLDREMVSFFEFHIVATDMGTPKLTSSAILSISVEDVNDNPPQFNPLTYFTSLNELVQIGTSVTTVFAEDEDSGANKVLSYYILSGSEGNFEVDTVSGLVKTTGLLNRELSDNYVLIVVAFDSGSPIMTGTGTVSIVIEDFNDNKPVFTQSLYSGNIDENSLGIVVLNLVASDSDKGDNAVLVFGYQDPIAGSSLPFIIDSISGEVTVNGQLDRESTDIYSFEVIVRDSAMITLNQLTATANVIIYINDLNDVAPSFPGVTSFRTSIQETTRITTIILSPVATDPDLGDGGTIEYSLSPISTIFSVDNTTGEIQLIQSLDFDSNGPNGFDIYQLNLVATDRGTVPLSGSVDVIITVLDENDNVPVFGASLYSVAVPENTTVGTNIITLTATDSDTSGTIKFDIVGGNLDSLFSIDEDTGIVSNSLPLFDLTNKIHELTIRAYESGDNSKSSLTSLHIEISDTNDNPPFFCQTADYEFSISENSSSGLSIGQICGSDKDTGINGEFSFNIDSGDDQNIFTISQDAGASTAVIIVLIAVLDREKDDQYILVLSITDKGFPPLQSLPIVASITILDENDGIPMFLNLPVSIDLFENTFGGTNVFKVVANDSDILQNADIIYEIFGGNIDNVFRIEPETGQITTIASLNFNTNNMYTLEIRASDKGSTPRSTTSNVYISIIDINDHSPLFMPPYEISIPENTPMSSPVITVSATDNDATTNAELVYAISSGFNAFHFVIDTTTGDISVNVTALDRETQSSYNLVVTACDKGVPIMCTDIGVTITITDTNDHIPLFSQLVYSFTVLEDRFADFTIGRVIATDLDSGSNGDITFIKMSGYIIFTINQDTGEILVNGELDREIVDFYQLVIIAQDNGIPMLSTSATINITILDVNDNTPIIDITQFSTQVNENTNIGDLVFDVDATDKDEGTNSRIILSLLGGHFGDFLIDPDSGNLHVNNSLSAERTIRYEVLIQASDSANPPLMDIKTLVINIIDINEFAPLFGQASYFVYLPENSPSGTFLLSVTASDADVQNTVNSDISFSIPILYSSDFYIDSVTGTITTITSFDREVSGLQTLVVKAFNPNVTPLLEGSAIIQITITDVNDQIPLFTNNFYSQNISELSPLGFQVLSLDANDNDDPNLGNGRISFSSASENSAEFDRSFRINSNGMLEVNGILDREKQDSYTAIAVVNDEGNPSLSSTTMIYIALLDENDVPPTFNNSIYYISYPEDLDPSSQNGLSRLLVTLGFTDGDSDVNFQQSIFRLSGDSPYSAPQFSVTENGELYINIGLDREARNNYTLYVEVINTAIGRGSFCDSLDLNRARIESNQCRLYNNATVYVTVVDINDNTPIFSSSPFYFAILESVEYNSEVGFIDAVDSDLSTFGEILYSISGTSDFFINEISGVLQTNVIFSGRVGQILSFLATASDQAVTNQRSSSVTIFISIIDNQYLIQIVMDLSVEKTQICLNQLLSKLAEITGYQIHIFDIQEHMVGITVFPFQTDVFIYSFEVSGDSLTLVTQSVLIRKIDDYFGDLVEVCDGKVNTVSVVNQVTQPIIDKQSSSVQIILIITVCIVILLCGFLTNFLALYQRILGKRSLKRSEEYIYGGMEGLDVLTTTLQDMTNVTMPKPFPIREELTYESQELKMDLFLEEIPEEEFISGSDRSNSDIISGNSLLEAVIEDPNRDDQNISISSI